MAEVTSTNTRVASSGVRVRKNIRHLSERELNDLRNAYEGLYKVSADGGNDDERGYQWIAGVHGLPTPFYCQHGNLNFPTWHRAYIYEFELRLQEQVAGVMLPYWDWTSEQSLNIGMPAAVTDLTYQDLNTGETKPNPLLTAFSQATGTDTTRSPSPISGLQRLKTQVDLAQRQTTYDRYSPALENPHGGLHVWVGGDMGSVPRAAFDPIFWLHHCNVDRLWFEWQRAHGDSTVPQAQLDFVCAPFTYTGGQTLDTKFFDYTYVDGEGFTEVDNDAAQNQGGDNEIQIDVPIDNTEYKHAFLEILGLSKTIGSYKLNIYLGEGDDRDDANNENIESGFAESIFLLGHGECAGGVGHCTLKPKPAFDKRPPHHLQPFNTYVDITQSLRRYNPQNGIVPVTIKVFDDNDNPASNHEIKMKGISLVTHQ
ncbi:tyrosinase family protein [Echinimonas agarilytica]|uniref:Tyrosinase family protein n=1 Tax=Echinimonas agarilytica TaxID=1215918 RepID=A0AA42B8L4_9GAMM|nr:tyrosinase family protein [Echinimonas agarilytica]MCM2681084.1 tyrosinase family protein [Echinimonas agarilytica]